MTIFGNSNELEKLAHRETELLNQKHALTASLATAEKAAGEILADGEAEREIAAVVSIRARLSAIDLAIVTLRNRRPVAIAAQFSDQARTIRAQASEKRKELAGIEGRTSKLLRQLSEAEGVPFTADILLLQASGHNAYFAPKSEILKGQISALDAQADELESRVVPDYGFIDLDNVTADQAVIVAALTHPSNGPTAEAVHAFLSACTNTNRLPDRTFGARPRRVRIEWTRGEITAANSYVYVKGMAPKRESTAAYPIDAFDNDAATFKAA